MALKHIHIAIPAYTRQIYADTFSSLVAEMMHAGERGYYFHFDQICGASDIPALRNAFLSRFLHGEGHKLVFIDADLAWDVGSITKLIEHEQDFVMGGYRYRSEPEKYPIHFLPGPIRKKDPATGEVADDDDPKGLVEIRCAAGGLMCLSRAAVERMCAAYPKLKYNDFLSTTGKPSWGLFDNFHKDETRWSEDLAFCLRWREIGGKVWMDIDLNTYHIGPTAFAGNVKNYLIAQHEKQLAERAKLVEAA